VKKPRFEPKVLRMLVSVWLFGKMVVTPWPVYSLILQILLGGLGVSCPDDDL
jgi:hypothetical protein